MKIYLAAFKTIEKKWLDSTNDIYLLSSFYEHKTGKYGDYVKQKKHLLDSGAFSFFGGKKTDWIEYADKYAEFINKTNQQLFFELDIDTIKGLSYAEMLRNRIEKQTNKQSIPVWRPSRGVNYWYRMCEEYNYVAISASGAYDSSWRRKKRSIHVFNKMIAIAKQYNTKVHGLGFTTISQLKKIPFYSVDSTTWLNAQKYGELHYYSNGDIKRIRDNRRLKNSSQMQVNNFREWVKFQRYADKIL